MYAADNDLGFTLKKNSVVSVSDIDFSVKVRSNSSGLRDNDHPSWVDGSGILVVGDSFAMGHGVKFDKTFPVLLENRLNVGIIKAGMESYSSRQAFLMMKRMIVKFPPEFVVFTFYEGNDWGDDLYVKPFHTVYGGYLVRPGTKHNIQEMYNIANKAAEDKNTTFLGTDNNILSASKLYRYMRYKLLLSGLIINPFLHRNKDGTYDCPLPIYTPYLKADFPENKTGKKQWELTVNTFLDAKKLADKNGSKLIVIIIPDKIQACDSLRISMADQCANLKQFGDSKIYNFSSAGMKLTAFLEQNGIDVVNMLPYFQHDKHPEQIYFPFDPHLSPYGHQFIANVVEAKIKTM